MILTYVVNNSIKFNVINVKLNTFIYIIKRHLVSKIAFLQWELIRSVNGIITSFAHVIIN